MIIFQTLRHRIGWSVPHVAGRLDVSERTAWRWEKFDAPRWVLDYLQGVADAVEQVPVPEREPAREKSVA